MNEPLKPRIDFSGPLTAEHEESFKTAQRFSEADSKTFAPAVTDDP